jgi:hypothetical protein
MFRHEDNTDKFCSQAFDTVRTGSLGGVDGDKIRYRLFAAHAMPGQIVLSMLAARLARFGGVDTVGHCLKVRPGGAGRTLPKGPAAIDGWAPTLSG